MSTSVYIASSIFFILYLAVLVLIGLKQAKGIDSMESYWMVNRNLPGWRIAFCLAAGWFGLSSFTGQAGWCYSEGLGALFYLGIPNAAAILIIGLVFANRIRKLPALSQPEFLEMRYSQAIRPWLALIILLAFAGYNAMEFIALNYVFEEFMGWPGWIGAIVIVIITLLYVNLGGMNTVVMTQVVQYGMLFLVGAVVGIAAIVKGSAIINAGDSIVPAGTSIFSVPTLASGSWYSFLGLGIGTTLILILAYWPGWSTEQDPWQRIWMARDEKAVRRGTLMAVLAIACVYTFTVFMAIGAWVIVGEPSAQAADFNSELIVYLLIERIMPAWTLPVIIVGFMAAAMSNISVFATSSASNLAKDIYQRYLRPNASQREMVWISRGCIALTLALGIFAGYVMPSILDAVFMAASLASCGYFIPIVGALFWRRGNTQGALAAFILGSASYLTLALGSLFGGWEVPIDPVIIGMSVSLLSYVIVSLATAPPALGKLVGFFPEDAEAFINDWKQKGFSYTPSSESMAYVKENLSNTQQGDRNLLICNYTVSGADFSTSDKWKNYIKEVIKNKSWLWLSGYEIIYKIVMPDMLGNIRLARGKGENDIMFYCEPLRENVNLAIESIAIAIDDLKAVAAHSSSK
jgi:SSS family solute:Na+ symporter